jgi:hypothetical protein
MPGRTAGAARKRRQSPTDLLTPPRPSSTLPRSPLTRSESSLVSLAESWFADLSGSARRHRSLDASALPAAVPKHALEPGTGLMAKEPEAEAPIGGMESRSRRSSGPSSDMPRIATCRGCTPGPFATSWRRCYGAGGRQCRRRRATSGWAMTRNAPPTPARRLTRSIYGTAPSLPFVRPTPQSDPWRRDRGRIVS